MARRASFLLLPWLALLLVSVSCTRGPQSFINVDKNGVALKGYDPVAYFTEGKPVKGSEEYSYRWKDAEWRFSSAGHLALFREDPEKYAPQYGGY